MDILTVFKGFSQKGKKKGRTTKADGRGCFTQQTVQENNPLSEQSG